MDDRALTEQIISKEVLFDGKVVHLERWQVRLPNLKTATREAIAHVGAAAVVAADDAGRIAMVRQHRVVVGEVMLEVPAGKLNFKGEDTLVAAQRELREETGLTAEHWTRLAHVVTTPGFCDERIALYLATTLTQGELCPDEDEFLNVRLYPAAELYGMVYRGEIADMKSVAALLLAKPILEEMKLI
ncbi:NUDIX hydrolase [Bacillota bacterium Meth-B3]|nr:NUDIX hydrolase [Christensenellaceae bacterium]MEA5066932.1 NUDIX hydrolase [Eubacteriales bacterium]MEA5068040.1 NUDIX hydrolase [Christensenellaceae bacterium]